MTFSERGRAGYEEGFGTDAEMEESADMAEIKDELGNFETDWRTAGNEDIFDAVLERISAKKDIESIRSEISRLDKQLVETDGDEEEINNILAAYIKKAVRGGEPEDAEEEDRLDMAA